MIRPAVKICGLTRLEDADAAIHAGAAYLGLIFVPQTPRYLSIASARDLSIHIGNRAKRVGVFQNVPVDHVLGVLAEVPLDYIQCHGQEDFTYCQRLPKPVIKVIPVTNTLDIMQYESWFPSSDNNIEAVLFDPPKGQSAGDWGEVLAAQLQRLPVRFRFFVAGGLTPMTVADVIETCQPDGVDVASGVEVSPGIKDVEKMHHFCQVVQAYSISAGEIR